MKPQGRKATSRIVMRLIYTTGLEDQGLHHHLRTVLHGARFELESLKGETQLTIEADRPRSETRVYPAVSPYIGRTDGRRKGPEKSSRTRATSPSALLVSSLVGRRKPMRTSW